MTQTTGKTMNQKIPTCPIRVGTSGYSYSEWAEAGFYPPGTPGGKMLSYYAGIFTITELNYTWYQMPKAESIERMQKLVSPDFMFAAKLTRTMTHEIDPAGWPGQVDRFRDGIAPLVQAGQLAAILIQLPPSFDRSAKNRIYLAALLEKLTPLPVAVEFRNDSWAVEKVYQGFAERRVTLASVDVPSVAGLFPSTEVVTNPEFFYIRFHGRNAKGWRSGSMQAQFDYNYAESELKKWVEGKITRMVPRVKAGFVFFNNHVRAQAPENARTMIRLLADAGPGC